MVDLLTTSGRGVRFFQGDKVRGDPVTILMVWSNWVGKAGIKNGKNANSWWVGCSM